MSRAGVDPPSEDGSQRLGDSLEVAAYDGPLGLVESGVHLREPGLHGLEQGIDLLAAGDGDLDLGATAVAGVGASLDVPAGGQPVDDA